MSIPPVSEQRTSFAAMCPPPHPDGRDEVIAGVPVHVLEPPGGGRATYLHIHGGGWTMGGASMQDPRLWKTATDCDVRVVSVEYRLAPEHPWPAAPDDCEAVARALEGPLVIGGESAGAHLAAVTMQRLRGRFLGANLVYGCYDLGMSPSQRLWGDRELVLSTPIIAWHLDQVLPGLDREARRDPSISPLYAPVDDVPPALLSVGTDDPMLDDSRFLAARWPGAELAVYDGMFHGFDLFPGQPGEASIERQHAFLNRILS
jgi:acetyl esterase